MPMAEIGLWCCGPRGHLQKSLWGPAEAPQESPGSEEKSASQQQPAGRPISLAVVPLT